MEKNDIFDFVVDSINFFVYFIDGNSVFFKKNLKTNEEFVVTEFEKTSYDYYLSRYSIMIKKNIIFIYDDSCVEGYIYNHNTEKMLTFSQARSLNKNISLFDRKKSSYYILYDDESIIYWDEKNNAIKKYNFVENFEVRVLKFGKNKDVVHFEMYDNGFIVIVSSPDMPHTIGSGEYDAVCTILLPKEFYE